MGKKQNPQAARAYVEAWNAKHPPGTEIDLRREGGQVRARTMTFAQVISGGKAVIWIEGMRGSVPLECCEPINE